MLRHRRALVEEILSLVSLAAAAAVAIAAGVGPAVAIAVAILVYAFWHLTQMARLLMYLRGRISASDGWVIGFWRDAFEAVRWIKRRERKRKRHQRRLFSSLRKIATAITEGVVILGANGEISWINPQAIRYFGLEDRALQGRRLLELVNDPILRDYLEAGDFQRALELEAPADPSTFLSISVTRVDMENQRYLLVARDITGQHYLEQSQRDFSLNVSHELRTPLTVIHGYIETLFEAEDPQSARWAPLSQMLQQTHRMQDVIEDMLMLSQLESKSVEVPRQPVAVSEILEEIVRDAERLARDTEHVLELNGDDGLLLLGDASLLRSAFSNLVFNAIRHTLVRTRVTVSWGINGQWAELVVRDNGAGIPARHLPRLTERFYRVDAGRSRKAGGSGLGLAIVNQILDAHDAKLLVSSEEGRGTTFTCRFPATRWRKDAGHRDNGLAAANGPHGPDTGVNGPSI